MTATEEQESTPIFTELTEQLGFSQDTVAEAAREQAPPENAKDKNTKAERTEDAAKS